MNFWLVFFQKSKMATKKFLNVQYLDLSDRIKVTEMEDLSEVRDKIKEKFELARGRK